VYDDNLFASQLAKHKLSMVAFYAPWCGYSKAMLPEFDKASMYLKDNNIVDIALVKMDCWTTTGSTCAALNIAGYPTMKVYKSGVYYRDYVGARKFEEILTDLITIWNTEIARA